MMSERVQIFDWLRIIFSILILFFFFFWFVYLFVCIILWIIYFWKLKPETKPHSILSSLIEQIKIIKLLCIQTIKTILNDNEILSMSNRSTITKLLDIKSNYRKSGSNTTKLLALITTHTHEHARNAHTHTHYRILLKVIFWK